MLKNKIDVSLIPARDRKNLSITFLGAVERFFDDPANQRAFKEWQDSQEDKNVDQRRKADDNCHYSGSSSGVSGFSCVDCERHSYAH
ncbi:MAG: hypothetical protein IJ497_01905 [Clostridia bacterium]|nr:hypothetical protein [Clostridia bacterium]